MPDLAQNVFRLSASFASPDVRDDAVGAEIIAAVTDVDAGLVRDLAFYRQILRNPVSFLPDFEDLFSAFHSLRQKGRKTVEVVDAEDHVHEGIGLPNALHLILFLHHAAAEDDQLEGMLPLHAVQVAQMSV